MLNSVTSRRPYFSADLSRAISDANARTVLCNSGSLFSAAMTFNQSLFSIAG